MTVFVLSCSHCEFPIGVFATEELAKAAIDRGEHRLCTPANLWIEEFDVQDH